MALSADRDIDALESDLAEIKAQMSAARQAFSERMIRLGAEGMRTETLLREAYVKAGQPLPRHLGRPSTSDHPLIKAVGNLRAWADSVGEPYSTVKKWVYYGVSPPEHWQKRLREQYRVPLSTWARVVKTRAPKPRKRKAGK